MNKEALIERIRAARVWLAYSILPKDVAKSIDYTIAVGYAIEEEEGWAKAGDPKGETRTLYMPATMWPLYAKFMGATCLMPASDIYAEVGL